MRGYQRWSCGILSAWVFFFATDVFAVETFKDKYFTIGKIRVIKLPSKGSATVKFSLEKNLEEGTAFGEIDQLVAYGKQMWQLVKAGQPVYNQTMENTLSVVPKDLGDRGEFFQMTNWSRPSSTNYRLSYENLYGMEVVRFDYTVYFQYGGQYRDQGKYLTSVTIYPIDVMVAWGYKLDAISKVASITNNGTKEEPIAGVTLQVESVVKTVVKTQMLSTAFHLTGDGELLKLN